MCTTTPGSYVFLVLNEVILYRCTIFVSVLPMQWTSGFILSGSCDRYRCLSVVIAGMKHHDQKQDGEEMIYLAYASTLQFIIKGYQGRNSNKAKTWRQKLMQKPWRRAAY